MLQANKKPSLEKFVFTLLGTNALRSSFARVNVRCASAAPDGSAPVLLFGNHSSWWDGHLPYYFNSVRWRLDQYTMVEDTQLQRYQFFRWLGAFSVNRHNARSAIESLTYATHLLTSAKKRMVMMYPQGEILANDTRPLQFFSGAGRLVKEVAQQAGACACYPIALRYEFIGEQKPEAFLSIGKPLVFDSAAPNTRVITQNMEQALTQELDALRDDIAHYRLNTFEVLLDGAWSVNRFWDAVRGKQQMALVGRKPATKNTQL